MYVENFTNKFLKLCEMTIPNKFITIRPSDPPWFNGFVRKLIRRRKRAHKKAKRLDTAESWKTFRKLRNEVIAAIKASKNDLENKLVNNLKSGTLSGKDWWRTFKSLIGKENTAPIPLLNHNGEQINDPTEKVNVFNKYQFQSQYIYNNKPVPNLPHSANLLSSIIVQTEEVCIILKALDTGKTCGSDQISKEVAEAMSEPLTNLFNSSLSLSSVPDIWKKANCFSNP